MTITTENKIAKAVMKIAAKSKDGVASFQKLRNEIPDQIALSADDLAPSYTRGGEPMWHQILRNIQSHHEADDNYINRGLLEHVPRVGYKITAKGRLKIA